MAIDKLYEDTLALIKLDNNSITKLEQKLNFLNINLDDKNLTNEELKTSTEKDYNEQQKCQTRALKLYEETIDSLGLFEKIIVKLTGQYSKNMPNVPLVHSEETKLLYKKQEIENLLTDKKDAIMKIPELLQSNKSHLNQLEEKIQTLEDLILTKQIALNEKPQEIKEYSELISKLNNYETLTKSEQNNIVNIFKKEYENLPNFKKKIVRDVIENEISEKLNSIESKLASYEFEIETHQDEIKICYESIYNIEETVEKMKDNFSPALHSLYKLRAQYEKLKIFIPNFRMVEDLQSIREKAPELIDESNILMQRAMETLENKQYMLEQKEIVYEKLKEARKCN